MALFSKKDEDAVPEKPGFGTIPESLRDRVKPKGLGLAQKARRSIYAVTGALSLGAFVIMVGTAMGLAPFPAKFATDWFLVALLFGAGPFAYFRNRDLKRIEQINQKFPDFLRDLAESARAGMTLPRALMNASRGTYGTLSEEIKIMAAQVEWGVSFDEAIRRFADRIGSPLIHRITQLIVEAQRSGGSVVDVLAAASTDAREIQQIVESRNQQMSAYSMVIYISFFVFLAVVLVLQAQFIPAFKVAVDAATGSGAPQVGGLKFKQFEPEDFNTLFFHAGIAQAIGGGLVGGVLTRGKAIAGMNSIVIMIVCSWLAFRVVVGAL
ncbi:MAG: type II secretion system F family protein [Candidatus Thermoplasmatota archaeon]